jgi:hypothetical protein
MHNTPHAGAALPFNFPYLAGGAYSPGRQINAPGESCQPYGPFFNLIPWPKLVPTISALANFPGMPRDYPVGISNNATATFPNNILFIQGFSGKSKG